MKNFAWCIASLLMMFLTYCAPSKEEIKKREKFIADSIAEVTTNRIILNTARLKEVEDSILFYKETKDRVDVHINTKLVELKDNYAKIDEIKNSFTIWKSTSDRNNERINTLEIINKDINEQLKNIEVPYQNIIKNIERLSNEAEILKTRLGQTAVKQ